MAELEEILKEFPEGILIFLPNSLDKGATRARSSSSSRDKIDENSVHQVLYINEELKNGF